MYYYYQVLAIVFGFLSEGDLELKKSGCLVNRQLFFFPLQSNAFTIFLLEALTAQKIC